MLNQKTCHARTNFTTDYFFRRKNSSPTEEFNDHTGDIVVADVHAIHNGITSLGLTTIEPPYILLLNREYYNDIFNYLISEFESMMKLSFNKKPKQPTEYEWNEVTKVYKLRED